MIQIAQKMPKMPGLSVAQASLVLKGPGNWLGIARGTINTIVAILVVASAGVAQPGQAQRSSNAASSSRPRDGAAEQDQMIQELRSQLAAMEARVAVGRADRQQLIFTRDLVIAELRRRAQSLIEEPNGSGEEGAIRLLEEVVRIDPGRSQEWLLLSALYHAAANLSQARRAAEKSLQAASGDAERRSEVLERLVLVLSDQNDLPAARARGDEYLTTLQRLIAEDPSSDDKQLYLALGYAQVGRVYRAQSDFSGAQARFDASLQILRRLSETYPDSEGVQKALQSVQSNVGDLLLAQGDLGGARKTFEAAVQHERMRTRANPNSTDVERNLAVSLSNLSRVLVKQKDLGGARALLEESLQIRQRLAAANPDVVDEQRYISIDQLQLGGVLLAMGDLTGARKCYESSLRIRRSIATSDPTSAPLRRGVWEAMGGLARVPGSGMGWREVLAYGEEMQRLGMLSAGDSSLDAVRELAQKENTK